MRSAGVVLPTVGVLALALVGCSASPTSAAEKCGGEESGISLTADGVLEYDQSGDSSGDAWQCVLDELVPDTKDQHTITQGLDGSPARDGKFNGFTVVYALNSERGIQLYFNP